MSLRGKMIKMKMSDGAEIGVYHVEPEGERRGGLVLIQEIFGVTEHIKEICDGYAADGYEVLDAGALRPRSTRLPGQLFAGRHSESDQDRARRTSVRSVDQGHADLHQRAEEQRSGVHHRLLLWRLGDMGRGGAMRRSRRCIRLLRRQYRPDDRPETRNARRSCISANTITAFRWTPCDKIEAAHPEVKVYVYNAGHGFNSDRSSRLQRRSRTKLRHEADAWNVVSDANGGCGDRSDALRYCAPVHGDHARRRLLRRRGRR